jgi:CheY-like chemotaxis protein
LFSAAMPFKYRILVVDDEKSLRLTSAAILEARGYEVHTAADGFEALVELRRSLPDVIISDLRMPNMSGFELLSVVRRRFPQIPVIAISGEYDGTTPEGLIADHYFSKGGYSVEDLFRRIAELLASAPLRPTVSRPDKAPVWIPKNANGYFVVTCPECLRSFSVSDEPSAKELRETSCTFCESRVCFLADPRSHVTKPKR